MANFLKLLAFLRRLARNVPHSTAVLFGVVATGIIGGLTNTALVALTNQALAKAGTVDRAVIVRFAALCVMLPLFRFTSQVLLQNLSQRSMLELRLDLSRRILGAPLRRLEEVGPHRLTTVLTVDFGQIIEALTLVPMLTMHLAVLVSLLGYLGWMSPRVLGYLLVVLVVGVAIYRLPARRAARFVARARAKTDVLLKYLRSLAEGTKELKLHAARRADYLRDVEAGARAVQYETRRSLALFAAGASLGQAMFFSVVGILLFALPRIEPVSAPTLIAFTLVVFQLAVPLEAILNAMPTLARSIKSVEAIERIGISLEGDPRERRLDSRPQPGADWAPLELAGVEHSYRAENAGGEVESFHLGPIDLSFPAGELIFLIGGNGSGKTTLAKILLGLYPPERGEIRIAGRAVTDDTRADYRELFAAVFSDFHLFERLLGSDRDGDQLDAAARRYLERLRLSHKVKIAQGEISSIELSQGQRKRLALLAAFLEDRQVYLFDEWAADQDPFFKEVFYREILPEFKARGKTVFVISHDDHYYGVADRLIKLDAGQVEFDVRSHDATAIAASFARSEGARL